MTMLHLLATLSCAHDHHWCWVPLIGFHLALYEEPACSLQGYAWEARITSGTREVVSEARAADQDTCPT